MTDGVRPIPPIASKDRRASERRTGQRRSAAEASASRALVPTEAPIDPPPFDPAEPAGRPTMVRDISAAPAAAFAAQLIGQGGQRNGIRGGPPVLDAARSTYLASEYSGDKERRPGKGKTGKTDV
ncbi:hypothetical protein BH09PSE1_BH09PSE1_07180 [soil metagenome]